MSKSNIEWTDATWNPVAGCAKVSAGCKHCYAESMAHRNASIGRGPRATKGQKANGAMYGRVLTDRGKWNGTFLELPDRLSKPLHWRKPRSIFVNSMSDLFGEGVSFEFIGAVFAIMAATELDTNRHPWHRYQLLTKRPARARKWFAWFDTRVQERMTEIAGRGQRAIMAYVIGSILGEFLHAEIGTSIPMGRHIMWPLPHVMLGVSAENQATWDERVPLLVGMKERGDIALAFVSAEPLLGPIDVVRELAPYCPLCDGQANCPTCGGNETVPSLLDWLIIGCESRGSHLGRPTQLEWVQSLGKAVLDAQPPYASLVDDYLDNPSPVPLPALFVKQLDVCQECHGIGSNCEDCIADHGHRRMTVEECETGCICGRTGQAGKLIKTPRIKFAGHPAQSYEQQPEGW